MTRTPTLYDLSSAAFRADPFPTFAEMRREAPIYPVEEDGPVVWNRGTVWYTLRFADSLEVLNDPVRFVKDFKLAFDGEEVAEISEAPYFTRLVLESLIAQEDPRHARLRALVNKAFSPSRIRSWRGRVEAVAEELLDTVEERGTMDLIADFAFRLPVAVITGILGLPASDGERLRAWVSGANNPRSEEELARSHELMEELFAYLREEFEARRREPRDDLISALLEAEIDGQRLDEHEMLSMTGLLVGAGFETTMNLIGNSTLNLLRHPGEMERLRREPDLIVSAVEELLRFEGSLYTATPRWAAVDVDFHGVRIRRGDRVFPMILSANRDEDRFEDPDRLDLGRGDGRHLGFGRGIHFCLGAPLARLEAQIALNALLRRFSSLRLDGDEKDLEWVESPLFHGLERLPLAWDGTSAG